MTNIKAMPFQANIIQKNICLVLHWYHNNWLTSVYHAEMGEKKNTNHKLAWNKKLEISKSYCIIGYKGRPNKIIRNQNHKKIIRHLAERSTFPERKERQLQCLSQLRVH